VIVTLVACWLSAATPAASAPGPPAKAPETPAPSIENRRCVIIYDGRHELCGNCEPLADGSITINAGEQGTHTLAPNRIVHVQWLLDVPAPVEGVVELIDGRQLRGLIRSDSCAGIDMAVHGVPLTLSRSRISAAWLLEPLATRYQQLKAAMPLERAHAHLSLCRWLVREQAWDLAVTELEAHLDVHRSLEGARLLRVARAHAQLPAGDGTPVTPTSSAAQPRSQHAIAPVDDRAVNLVRVYEIDLADPPEVIISPEVRKAFLEAYADSTLLPSSDAARTALVQGPAIDVLRQMFTHRAREFYGSVQVRTEPTALKRFRQSVHDQWLVPRCGSTDCHGGNDAGRFRLVRQGRMDDRTRTSNLLILDSLTLDGVPMIDWQQPHRSLLVQHALPEDVADRPHPPVRGWRPTLDTLDGPRTLATIRWIEAMMRSPRPEYPVEPPVIPGPAPDSPRLPR